MQQIINNCHYSAWLAVLFPARGRKAAVSPATSGQKVQPAGRVRTEKNLFPKSKTMPKCYVYSIIINGYGMGFLPVVDFSRQRGASGWRTVRVIAKKGLSAWRRTKMK
jgi:hypothetical protein